MKMNLQKCRCLPVPLMFSAMPTIFLVLTVMFSPAFPQTFVVKGVVSTSTTPVQYVLVTFEDALDTTNRYSVLTDLLGNYHIDLATTAMNTTNKILTNFNLEQNYPNPFSSSTTIQYALKQHSDVYITIYDLLGKVVRKYDVGSQSQGSHWMQWDGCNTYGQKVATGLYFCRLEAGGESKVTKMIYDGGGINGVTSPSTPSVKFSKNTQSKSAKIQGRNFTVKIENSDNTYPVVVPKEIENVFLENDTTMNFTVTSVPIATIYSDSLKQYIRGFGAANILQWRPDMTSDQVHKAFGTGEGQIGFSILRLRVPHQRNEFSINVPTAKAAYSMGVKIIASPWTPPAQMKTNGNIVGGRLRDNSYQDYADHLKSFADYMSDNGVPLYAISVQNEPDIEVTYESCDWSPEEMVRFIEENAPSIGTRIIAPESFQFRRPISDAILNDSAACANLDIVGGHIYGGGLSSYPLAVKKGKELWMTEHLDLNTTWSGVLGTGKEINDCMNAGMNAYVWWYLVRFYGPISEDGNVSKRGYVMSQFARFIRPGYYRVECRNIPQGNIFVTAYKDSSSSKVVLVVLNTSSTLTIQQVFTIPDGKMTAFTPYTTTITKNCEQASDVIVTDGRVTVTLEPSSITTFLSN